MTNKFQIILFFSVLFCSFLFFGCSSAKETTEKKVESKNEVKVVPPRVVRNVELDERSFIKKERIRSVERLSFEMDNDGAPFNRKKLASMKYDENGFLVETVNYDDKGREENIFTYTYDGDKRTSTIRSTPEGQQDKKYTYEYNQYGNKVRSERYDMEGNLEKYYEYKYDDKGNLIEDLWYDKNGTPEYKIVYTYDDQGNKTEAKTYDENNSLINIFRFRYDDQNQLIEEIKTDPSGKKIGLIQYVYQYY